MSALSVLLDLRHPLASLALGPALAFARTRRLDVDWLPLSVPPLRPPGDARPGDDRGARHRRFRAEAIAREIATYGAAQGLVLREPYRAGEVEAANLGWLWLRERAPERLPAYLTALFEGYWSLALDASNRDAIAALLGSLAGDPAGFTAWAEEAGPAAAAALAEQLRERGIGQVPAYVVGDEVFYGRQHLPLIGWLLDGRPGAPPC